MKRILFVCMGNICRSPTAEGVFRKLVEDRHRQNEFYIDSAGTHAYHVGHSPDPRSVLAAKSRGIDIGGLRARQVRDDDFEAFDHILAMDRSNLSILQAACPKVHLHKIELFLSYAEGISETEVPDPYYDEDKGFEQVLDLVELAGKCFLDS